MHWLVLACLTSLGVLAGCEPSVPYQKPLVPVEVERAAAYPGTEGTHYSAVIGPHSQVSLAFKVGGYIEALLQVRGEGGVTRHVDAGDAVSAGTVLARLRQGEFRAKVAEATAQLAQARVSQQQATLEFERAQKLLATKAISRTEYDAIKARYDAANAQVEGAEARLAETKWVLADTELGAPMDGVILSRHIEVGSLVAQGTLAFVLADIASVEAVFGVPDFMLAELKRGDTLALTTEAIAGARYQGIVTTIAPSADPRSRVFQVELSIPNPERSLKPGMIATVTVGASPPRPELPVIPLNAVVRPAGQTQGFAVFVVTQEGGQTLARQRRVTPGQPYGNRIAIVSGLQPGEPVIVSGASLVVDGEPVRVIP
jgi:RND family efflux transporter MFP subunit